MRHVLWLSLRHLSYHRLRSGLLVACLAVVLAVPVVATLLLARYDGDMRERAQATPLVLGPRGSRFDLVLSTLYWRSGPEETVPWEAYTDVAGERGIDAVPMHVGFTARGRPLVATTPEYFLRRGLHPEAGTAPLLLGEVTLGSQVAKELGLSPGDVLYSDPTDLYNLTRPSSLELQVAGVFAPTRGPDDAAVFTDVKTAWVLLGLYHGHTGAEEALAADPGLELGRGNAHVALSGALIEHNRVDRATQNSFHLHGDPAARPLSAVLLWPQSAKAATLLKARINAQDRWRVFSPAAVAEELLGAVLRAKRLFDSVTLLLALSTLLLVALVLALSTRLREAELRTLDRIGCAPATIPALVATEALCILALAALAAAALAGLSLVLAPRLVQLL